MRNPIPTVPQATLSACTTLLWEHLPNLDPQKFAESLVQALSTAGPPPGQLLTVSAVARRLAVSQRQVWRWAHAGRLPPVNLGRRCVRFREADVVLLAAGGAPHRPA